MEKSVKNKLYRMALELLEERNGIGCFGICDSLTLVQNKTYCTNMFIHHIYDEMGYPLFGTEFPELVKHRPSHIDVGMRQYWFPFNEEGFEKRKEILKQAIKETDE